LKNEVMLVVPLCTE